MTIVEIFDAAVDLPESEREAFLQSACAGNEALLRKVRALLNAHGRVDQFIDRPPSRGLSQEDSVSAIGEKVGDQIGRYKLLQQIGEGGWGVVFMAEQEVPVRRRVALKIVKPGMDTKNVIARFEAERQALALMDHPNIAHIFDAGATDSGRPYFVMELIRGAKVTEYCDENSLTTAARLELFIEVCDAVQHAHQKGIIHRDIKPSNILVTTKSNGRPLAKVIDFGIAKATNQKLTEKTHFTAFEMLIGTPAYMSPEQAALTSVDVDTRSDIYSLGVLLYELLTGKTPFDAQELLKAGLDEIRRVIQTKMPTRPSTKLSGMVKDDLTTVSRLRRSDPPKLIRLLRGYLDCIVLKALEKDRALRYPTANAFAIEIRRYLAGELVSARPPSSAYRLRKLFRRHKFFITGVGIFFLLLIALLAFMGALLVRERELRLKSELLATEISVNAFVMSRKPERAEEDFFKALAFGQNLKPDYLPLPETFYGICQLFRDTGQMDKAETFLTKFLVPVEKIGNKDYIRFLIETRADLRARTGRWAEAEADAQKVRDGQPGDSNAYHRLATLMVANNDAAGYRRLCPEIVARFSNAQDPSTADKMAKDCLILPASGADLDAVAKMAEVAVSNGRGASVYPFFQCCKALAEYRQGHFESAANWSEQASAEEFPTSQAEAFAILSMAQYRLGAIDKARATLEKCGVDLKKLPPPGKDLREDWRDWIIAHALFSEATDLIHRDR